MKLSKMKKLKPRYIYLYTEEDILELQELLYRIFPEDSFTIGKNRTKESHWRATFWATDKEFETIEKLLNLKTDWDTVYEYVLDEAACK